MTRPEEIVARGYDRIADRYLAWSSDHSVRLRWMGEFRSALPPPARVLDLGCGAGVPVAQRLVEAGYEVTGIDVSPDQIARATANVPGATFLVGSMTETEFDPASFDGVFSTYAITHVPRIVHTEVFRRIHGWLRPGGVFVASLGAADSPDWVGEWLGVEMFFSHFDTDANLHLLGATGFTVERSEVVHEDEDGTPVPFLWVVARR